MSLSPPQFIKMLRSRDRASLVADLRSLAEEWSNLDLGASESMAGAIHGEANFKDSARQLRQVLDQHK